MRLFFAECASQRCAGGGVSLGGGVGSTTARKRDGLRRTRTDGRTATGGSSAHSFSCSTRLAHVFNATSTRSVVTKFTSYVTLRVLSISKTLPTGYEPDLKDHGLGINLL